MVARGQGHTTHGQSLVDNGLVIDMSSLDRVRSIGPDVADVEAGVKWNALTTQAMARGLTPPVLTGYLGLSVGGTLSVGGISSRNSEGAQVDRVRRLEVVTGAGDVVVCSETEDRELFEAVLGGLGQFGIIVRAEVDLVPAPSSARVYTIEHDTHAGLFQDLRVLLERGELEDVYDSIHMGSDGRWIHTLTASKLFDASPLPEDGRLLRGLTAFPQRVSIRDMSYSEYVLRVDTEFDGLRNAGLWDGVRHPWFDVFLPDSCTEDYVTEALSELGSDDVGVGGFFLLFPQRRNRLTRPMMRVPEAQAWVFLFDLLTAVPTNLPGDGVGGEMMVRNRRLFDRALTLGGSRYPIGSLEFSALDWRRHYGERWPEVERAKRRYDPRGILGRGLGVFGEAETETRVSSAR